MNLKDINLTNIIESEEIIVIEDADAKTLGTKGWNGEIRNNTRLGVG